MNSCRKQVSLLPSYASEVGSMSTWFPTHRVQYVQYKITKE